MHALIKKLAIRRVKYRSDSDESQHPAEGTEVARLRRRFSFVLQEALSFRTRHHTCRQRVALAGTRQLCLQGPVSVHAHCTKGVTGSERQEVANGVGEGIGVGGGDGDGNGVVGRGNGDVNGDGDGDGAGTEARVEEIEGVQDDHGDESGDWAGTGTGVETCG